MPLLGFHLHCLVGSRQNMESTPTRVPNLFQPGPTCTDFDGQFGRHMGSRCAHFGVCIGPCLNAGLLFEISSAGLATAPWLELQDKGWTKNVIRATVKGRLLYWEQTGMVINLIRIPNLYRYWVGSSDFNFFGFPSYFLLTSNKLNFMLWDLQHPSNDCYIMIPVKEAMTGHIRSFDRGSYLGQSFQSLLALTRIFVSV